MKLDKILPEVLPPQYQAPHSAPCSASSAKPETAISKPADWLQQWPSATELCKAFAPGSQQIYALSAERAFGDPCPRLADFRRLYNISAAVWLIPQLNIIDELCGARGKMNERQFSRTAYEIAARYHYLKLSEVMRFVARFCDGDYGRFYGSIDPQLILTALAAFMRERAAYIAESERTRERRELEASYARSITYEQYRKLQSKQPCNNTTK